MSLTHTQFPNIWAHVIIEFPFQTSFGLREPEAKRPKWIIRIKCKIRTNLVFYEGCTMWAISLEWRLNQGAYDLSCPNLIYRKLISKGKHPQKFILLTSNSLGSIPDYRTPISLRSRAGILSLKKLWSIKEDFYKLESVYNTKMRPSWTAIF